VDGDLSNSAVPFLPPSHTIPVTVHIWQETSLGITSYCITYKLPLLLGLVGSFNCFSLTNTQLIIRPYLKTEEIIKPRNINQPRQLLLIHVPLK